jgi:hypothetical protein
MSIEMAKLIVAVFVLGQSTVAVKNYVYARSVLRRSASK